MIDTFWKRNVKNIPTFARLTGSYGKVDVCVIGGGITGLSCALKLSEQPKLKIAVIDAGPLASGVSAFTTAKVSLLQRLKCSEIAAKHGQQTVLDYIMMNEAGLNEIRTNIQKLKIDCEWRDVSQYTYTTDTKDLKKVADEVDVLQRYGLRASTVTEIPELPFTIQAAVKLEHQGEFNSYKYCMGLVRELEKRNCQFFENSMVTDVSFSSSPHHVVTTEDGSIDASEVVIATHLPILDRSGHFGVCSPSKSYCMAFEMKEGTAPRDGYISTGQMLENKSIRSANDGKVLIVAGSGHTQGEPPSGSTTACYQELERFAREYFKVGNLICHWSALDYYTADQLPYIGYLHHGTSTLYTATGFAKWGFTQGAASGIAISDLIINKTAPIWQKTFDARRWDLTKSTLQALSYQMHVSKHYAMVPLEEKMIEKLPDIENLVRDTGAICKDHSGKIVGGYRDLDGKLHVVNPNCSHLGCRLSWNQGDRQWDCPCHGSVFSVDGVVRHGPAVKKLSHPEQK